MKKLLTILLALLMVFSLVGCSGNKEEENPAEGDGEETVQHHLGIIWPDTQIEFYNWAANLIKSKAEEAGWKVEEIAVYDWDTSKQIEQFENFATMGCTDIISIATDSAAIVDVCKKLRQQGINLNFFAMAPADLDAYDSVTVADQYAIGVAMAENAVDWVNEKYPDAPDGSIKAAIITLPTDEDNIARDNGIRDTLAACPKITIVKEYEQDAQDDVKVQETVDTMMLENPDIQVLVCHFASMSLAADERLSTYTQIDRENFGIFSGDIDTMLGARIQKSVTNESLIRATGTYDPEGVYKQFDVASGKYDSELNDQKQYVYHITKFDTTNIDAYMAEYDGK